ncbi:MAG: universal stress protein [Saprospiraceae bacterium]|nr:universal stress protein [Saprospiraceae bacterium]
MKKLLLATDFSDACNHALDYSISLVHGSDLKIDLINVYDIPVVVSSSMPSRAIDGIMYEKAKAVESHLQELNEKIPLENRGHFTAIYGSYAATEIAEFVKKKNHDLIVMGLRQKYGLLDKMMGTVTAHTIQLSTVPVLAIPSQAIFSPYRKILFPTVHSSLEDISETETKAIVWLLAFAKKFFNPSIHMLHIEKDQSNELLDVRYKGGKKVKLDLVISHAETIEDGIINFYEKEHAELLAFYKPYRYFWERLYHSSLIRKVLFHSRIPLLIFR